MSGFAKTKILLLASVLTGIGLWIVNEFHKAKEAVQDSQCVANLGQIGIALLNYESLYGSLPPSYICDRNGDRFQSWRSLCMKPLEADFIKGRYEYTSAWDSQPSSVLSASNDRIFIYRCPSNSGPSSAMTDYVAIVGPNTAWPDGEAMKSSDIADGAANTILVIEDFDSRIMWMEPRDITIDDAVEAVAGPKHRHRDHFNALFADGRVRRISRKLPVKTLIALITANGAETVDLNTINPK